MTSVGPNVEAREALIYYSCIQSACFCNNRVEMFAPANLEKHESAMIALWRIVETCENT